MEKSKKMWIVIILIGIVSVTSLTIALASGSQQLDITNNAQVDPRTFGVEFSNLSSATITANAEVIVAPSLSSSLISGLKVRLPEIGSKISYTFNVTNTGDYDAEIDTLNLSTPNCSGTGASKLTDEGLVCENLIFTLTYTTGGTTVATDDELDSGETKNMTLTIGYSGATMPSDIVEIEDLNISISYVQK